jgi:hypothetical protein
MRCKSEVFMVVKLLCFSRFISRVKWLKVLMFQGPSLSPSAGSQTPMMGKEMVPKTSAILNQATRLIGRGDFTNLKYVI